MTKQMTQGQQTYLNQTGLTDDQSDQHYQYLKERHPEVWHYLRYEAPMPIDPQMVRHMASVFGTQRTLSELKRHVKNDTALVYGDDHPNVAEQLTYRRKNRLKPIT